jgi:hypothetical protein
MDESVRTPHVHAVDMKVEDAIGSVAVALITHTLERTFNETSFLDWMRERTGDETITRTDLRHDLNSVREALNNLGYEAP